MSELKDERKPGGIRFIDVDSPEGTLLYVIFAFSVVTGIGPPILWLILRWITYWFPI